MVDGNSVYNLFLAIRAIDEKMSFLIMILAIAFIGELRRARVVLVIDELAPASIEMIMNRCTKIGLHVKVNIGQEMFVGSNDSIVLENR